MPSSPIRRRSVYTPPTARKAVRVGSPPWLAPVMVGLFVLGLIWIVVYYVTQTDYPITSIGHWNLGIGFALILGGFGLATQWK